MKKAQAWGIDLIIATMIFSIGIVVFFVYSLNSPSDVKDKFQILTYEGENIINSILSNGEPDNWNENNVQKIGILNNGKINETKLNRFYHLSENDYQKTREIFNTKYDYSFIIEGYEISYIGKEVNLNALNLIKITRFIIYKNKPATAYIYIWEE